MDELKATSPIYTPNTEPYLGRELLHQFDNIILSLLSYNTELAPKSHDRSLTDYESMAGQLIAQSISIALSIRELIRQAYLFSGHVLLRSLIERVCILIYVHYYPNSIEIWKRGWPAKEAPSLSVMIDRISKKNGYEGKVSGVTSHLNSLVHGKPESAHWNYVEIEAGKLGHAVSMQINNPRMCDELCVDAILWIANLMGMMAAYFPDGKYENAKM